MVAYGDKSEVTEEKLLGEFNVIARLAIGVERLRLLLTDRRIIVAHAGKRGTAATSFTVFLGWLSAGLEDLFKSGRESRARKRLKNASPQEILAADRDNFSIGYEEVVSVDVGRTAFRTAITILTRDDKFEFTTGLGLEKAVRLLRGPLGAKLVVRELDDGGLSRDEKL